MRMIAKASVVALVLALSAAGTAGATTLTFGDLGSSFYGAGNPLLGNMASDGQTLSYTSDGYVLTLVTPVGNGGAHIGDGTGIAGTFNWHDLGSNGNGGAFVTLARVGGGAFSLTSFDYFSNVGLTVSSGVLPSLILASGSGTSSGFSNVNSISFYGADSNQLDNLQLQEGGAVPEPASWALMIGGFGLAGGALRRRQKALSRFA